MSQGVQFLDNSLNSLFLDRTHILFLLWENELPRRKQRGIKKNRDLRRRKQRGIKPVEAVPKAFSKSLIFFTLNFIWLLAQLRLKEVGTEGK